MKTSWSDRDNYRSICQKFVDHDEYFKVFRKYSPIYNEVLEHVNYDKGKEYLQKILENTPHFTPHFDEFRKNDLTGKPDTFNYGDAGQFSPTTLRYIKVLSDLVSEKLIDANSSIIEVGGGYGGQCRVIKSMFPNVDYSIIDLPEAMRLQNKYLSQYSINANFLNYDNIPNSTYDLFISNFAYNECFRETQQLYFDKFIKNSKHGYMSVIFYGGDGFSHEEFLSKLNEVCQVVKVKDYTPSTGFDCKIITW